MRETGGIDRYSDVEVRYISGHNPDLVMLDAQGEEVERIDLTKHSESQETLHALMRAQGFAEDGLRNAHADCADWAAKGECARNPAFMQSGCAKACASLKDKAMKSLRPSKISLKIVFAALLRKLLKATTNSF